MEIGHGSPSGTSLPHQAPPAVPVQLHYLVATTALSGHYGIIWPYNSWRPENGRYRQPFLPRPPASRPCADRPAPAGPAARVSACARTNRSNCGDGGSHRTPSSGSGGQRPHGIAGKQCGERDFGGWPVSHRPIRARHGRPEYRTRLQKKELLMPGRSSVLAARRRVLVLVAVLGAGAAMLGAGPVVPASAAIADAVPAVTAGASTVTK